MCVRDSTSSLFYNSSRCMSDTQIDLSSTTVDVCQRLIYIPLSGQIDIVSLLIESIYTIDIVQ